MQISRLSLVLPVFNEVESLPPLMRELEQVMDALAPLEVEVIFVDDGSKDGSRPLLETMVAQDARVKAIFFRKNFGQTAAMSCGIQEATGDVIIPMDADLQNDPADIPRLLEVIARGHDCVSGWRKNRWQGSYFTRRLPSDLANKLISWMTGVALHDYGCSMKAYTREAIQGIELYGEMHRFIPAYVAWQGGKVTELVLNDRPRTFGQSKYGFSRVFKVLLDLVVVKFLVGYFNKPIHFFGAVGFVSFALGALGLLTSVVLKVTGIRSFVATPLPVIGMMFVILGVQFILSGLLAEVLMRTYYGASKTRPYEVAKRLNFPV